MRRMLPALLLLPTLAAAQTNAASQAARKWRQEHERAIVTELVTLLAVPNVSSDKPNIQRNAELIAKMLQARGLTPKLVSAGGSNPVVVADIRTPGATRTIGLYAHYDGQPLDPKEWASPPFEPTLRDGPIEDGGTQIPLPPAGTPFNPEWRLYARGAGDDKAPIVAMLTALEAIRAAGLRMNSNIKLAFEGEEETGSPNLETTIAANTQLFAADLWLVCDGPVYQNRQQSIVFGARGVLTFEVTTYGARTELHSGHYGNWAPNPALELAQLLSSMKDRNGRVVIPGFYDQVEPLGPMERKAIADVPSIDAQLMRDFWLGATDDATKGLYELLTQPSLNIRGMASSRIGAQASNVIIVPIANHDDNQHTFNENLRIQNLWDGIELMAALLTM